MLSSAQRHDLLGADFHSTSLSQSVHKLARNVKRKKYLHVFAGYKCNVEILTPVVIVYLELQLRAGAQYDWPFFPTRA